MEGALSTIEGVVEKILFYNEDNNYCVAQIKSSDKNSFTITGTLPSIQCGETIEAKGYWQRHKSYGDQLKVVSFKSKLPSSLYGIKKFLGSGLIQGIGKGYAEKIVNRFGENTLKIIDEDSARLREVAGIGEKRVKEIKKSWDAQRNLREVVMQLRTYGVGIKHCADIVKKYGEKALSVIAENPYKLAMEISGIGFKTADQIALNSGIANESNFRIKAGLSFTLSEFEQLGHTMADIDILIETASQNLAVDAVLCKERLLEMINLGELVLINSRFVQLKANAICERRIAESLNSINTEHSCLPQIAVDKAVVWAQEKLNAQLSPEQVSAVKNSIKNKICVITGGPGTGKTTVLRAITAILNAKKVKIVLAAPTGRAAQRMAQSCNMPAQTIHRILAYNPQTGAFTYGRDKKLEADFVIVDESSMLDEKLANALFRAVKESAHLLLVGDIDQLPSVGAGNVLKDIIECGIFKTVVLKRIFRQSENSDIVDLAHDILDGKNTLSQYKASMNISPFRQVEFFAVDSPENAVKTALHLLENEIPKSMPEVDIINDVQFLLPMHKGQAGIGALNDTLQERLNKNTQSTRIGATLFKKGDKLIQTKNNYLLDVYNGDMGILSGISDDVLAVDFQGKTAEFTKTDAFDLRLAYAVSVHKSQGSEFPVVVLILMKSHFMLLQRNLLYTALTRAKKKAFIIGEPYAWQMAIANDKSLKRDTGLKQRLLSYQDTQWR